MSAWLRGVVAFMMTVMVAVVGVVYYRAGRPLIELAKGQHSGPWTQAVVWLDMVVPAVLVLLLLGTYLWVIAGSVQEERKRRVLR